MDFLCLYLSIRLQRLPVRPARLLTAAGIGAAFSVAAVVFQGGTWSTLALDLAAVLVMAAAVLPGNTIGGKRLFLTALTFLISEGALGGILTAVFYRIGILYRASGITLSEAPEKLRLFRRTAAAAGILLLLAARILLFGKNGSDDSDAVLSVFLNHQQAEFPCFWDSGNRAKEPISGLPVIFLPVSAAERLHLSMTEIEQGSIPGSRLIPYSTVDGSVIRWGLMPEKLLLSSDSTKKKQKKTKEIFAYLEFYEDVSSAKGSAPAEAILPADLIKHQY